MKVQKKKFKVTFEIEGKYLDEVSREKLSPRWIRFYTKLYLDKESYESQSDCKVKKIRVCRIW